MTLAVRTKTIVQPGGRVEIRSPDLTPGASAEVIVLVDALASPTGRTPQGKRR